jgi:phosphoacetylglucosamine mutase
MSNLLLVAAILRSCDISHDAWADFYTPLESRLAVVKVRNRHVVVTEAMDSRVKSPAGLQSAIEQAVAKVEGARSFVRASGTEDVVRVYAEARERGPCDALALEVMRLVHQFADGVGDPPSAL